MGSIQFDKDSWPSFDDLPLRPDGPRGNAWGLFGPNDELGRLNLLTAETVKEASKEIQEGIRIALDWTLDRPFNPSFERSPMKRHLVHKISGSVNDEVITFDTQGSTQWDGLKHFGYIDECLYYNGHAQRELESSDVLGTHVMVEKGGIVGRGVLLDWAEWADRNGLSPDPMTTYGMPVEHLIAIAKEQEVEFRSGDILFIRTGFTRAYNELTPEKALAISQRETPQFIGLEDSPEILRWIWDNKFAAIAGDQPAMEQCPLGFRSNGKYMLHQWCIGGWGMPLGEYFNLEELAQTCSRLKRCTFFLSSMPLNIPGGVASPPNAVAIF